MGLRELLDYCENTKGSALPPATIERAKQSVLDTLGAIISGLSLPVNDKVQDLIALAGDMGNTTIVGNGRRFSPQFAGLINGILAHADETDDSHPASLTHPGCMIIPAAMAIWENYPVSGREFLRAIVLSYEVQGRIGKSLNAKKIHDTGLLPLSAVGCHGAAMAAALVQDFNAVQLEQTLSLVGQHACGLTAIFDEPEHLAKSLVVGLGVRNGVSASLLVKAGFVGALPLDRYNNFFGFVERITNEVPEFAGLANDLGDSYEIIKTTIKKYPVGGPIQGPAEALLSIKAQHRFAGDEVSRIEVRLAKGSIDIVGERDDPSISLPYVMAVIAYDDELTTYQVHSPNRTQDEKVLNLKNRVALIADPDLSSQWPSKRPVIVTVFLKTGEELHQRVDVAHGYPERPLDWKDTVEKFSILTEKVISNSESRAIIDAVSDLDQSEDGSALVDTLNFEGWGSA